ncbi:hypothetical protein KI387_029258, partial [Taxus chinensis]
GSFRELRRESLLDLTKHGYCALNGSRLTFLFSGPGEQNRVVEGDVVSILMDPVSSWPKLK